MSPVLVRVRREQLRESRHHCRRVWGDIDGMAQSIREHGILEPPLVRRLQTTLAEGAPIAPDEPLEIVFGHRRNRAAGVVGLDELDVIVREDLTEAQALAIQMIENVQREDLHPLDEGDAYVHMLELGSSIEEIGASVGKSRSTIYGRLALAKLPEVARKALLEGEMLTSVGLLIARYPTSVQLAAAKKLLGHGAALNAGVASAVLQQQFATRLSLAPFPKGAAKLVPAAGPCTKCPKRSGVQAELFDETDVQDDLCLDTSCFRAKEAAHFQATAAKVEAKGGKVLTAAESKNVLDYSGQGVSAHSGYVDAKAVVPGTGVTFEEAAKQTKTAPTLAKGQRGPVVVFDRETAATLAKAVGGDLSAATEDDAELEAMRAKNEAERVARRERTEALCNEVRAAARLTLDEGLALRALLRMLEAIEPDTAVDVADRLSLPLPEENRGRVSFDGASPAQQREALVELILCLAESVVHELEGVVVLPPAQDPPSEEPESAPSEPPPASSPKPRARQGRAVSA